MRLTGKNSNFPKRAKQFINILKDYFNISDEEANNTIVKMAPIIRYFKYKNVYLTKNSNEIEIDNKCNSYKCNIILNTYIEDDSLYCEDIFTLLFPQIIE